MTELNEDQFGYRYAHQPYEDGAPIHDLTANETYPKDVYDNPHYYGERGASWNVISSVKGRPNAMVTIYRAVPKIVGETAWMSRDLDFLKKGQAEWQRRGKLPSHPSYDVWRSDGSAFYDHASRLIPKLEKQIAENPPHAVKGINPGDWVTLDREYAKLHGQGNIGGEYRILSKTVPASHVRIPGDSYDECGYFPPKEK